MRDNIITTNKIGGHNMGTIYKHRLKELREDKDITQQDIADILQITRQQYQLYESGEREIKLDKLKSLCLFYGVSSDYILGLPRGLKWPR